MSSMSQETRTRLDDSLALPFESWDGLKAAKQIDLKEVINQVKIAAESAEKLRNFVSVELPDAKWQTRQELDALLETIDKEIHARSLRAQLLNLSVELERGKLVHRRAARVEQMNQYRGDAVKELRAKAAVKGTPAQLPGPAAEHWIDWACGLEEPGDAQALGILRGSFPALDAFVSHLEPGMWQLEGAPEGATEAAQPRPERAKVEDVHRDMRERLLSLASELAQGSIVHHRAVRVTQLNQLRDEAVKELRTRSKGAGTPSPVPGPEVSQGVEWACSLKEPEDSEAIEIIRIGFPALDDFIAHLEPNMWVPGSPDAVAADLLKSSPRSAPAAVPVTRGSSKGGAAAAAAVALEAPPLLVDEDEENSLSDRLREKSKSVGNWMHSRKGRGKAAAAETSSDADPAQAAEVSAKAPVNFKDKRTLIAVSAAVLVIALGTIGWRSYRSHSANSVVRAETSVPENQPVTATVMTVTAQGASTVQTDTTPQNVPAAAAPSPAADNSAPSTDNAKNSKSKPEPPAPNPADSKQKPAQLNDAQLRTPAPIPKASNGSSSSPADNAPDMLALAGNAGANRAMPNVAVPAAKPQFGGAKGQPSSGVTPGVLIQSVRPVYPTQAQQAHVTGTVVLTATVGKDGNVQGVKVQSGPPMLTQAAVDAVKRWRYKPYYLNGEPVEAETEIKINFAPQ